MATIRKSSRSFFNILIEWSIRTMTGASSRALVFEGLDFSREKSENA